MAAREGWLLKRKKGRLGGWQRRFFALGAGALEYGAEEAEVKGGWARGTIPLNGVEGGGGGCVVEGGGQVLVLRARVEKDAEPREFQLKAESAAEAEAWAEALRAAVGALSLDGGGEEAGADPDQTGAAAEEEAAAAGAEDGATGASAGGGLGAAADGLPEGMQARQSVVGEVPPVLEQEPPEPHNEVDELGADAPAQVEAAPASPAATAEETAAPAEEAAAPDAPGEGSTPGKGNWGKVKENVDKAQKVGKAVEALTGAKPKPKRLYGADLVRYLEEEKKAEEARKGPRKKRVPKWKLEEGRWVINDQYVQEIVGGTVGTEMQEEQVHVVEYALGACRGRPACRKCGVAIPPGEEACASSPDEGFSYHKACTPFPMPCSECTLPIEGPVVAALGKTFHPDCFACCV